MSLNDTNSSSSDTLTAEFRDGRLQIVEFSPADCEGEDDQTMSGNMDTNYIHIVNESDNQGWQIGNLNFTIASCDDQESTHGEYAIITDNSGQLKQEYVLNNNGTYSSDQQEITEGTEDESSSYVIMFNPEADEDEDGEFVVLEDQETTGTGNDSYVVVHGKEGPMVFLQSQLQITQQQPVEPPPTVPTKQIPTALELLKKAKAVKQGKAILRESICNIGRQRNMATPSAEELLESPDFKIYLYSCKLCDFKCNRVKEMSDHKAKEHTKKTSSSKTRYPYKNSLEGGRSMRCARCPYRANVISDLLAHAKEVHADLKPKVTLQKESLVCQSSGGRPASIVQLTSSIGQSASNRTGQLASSTGQPASSTGQSASNRTGQLASIVQPPSNSAGQPARTRQLATSTGQSASSTGQSASKEVSVINACRQEKSKESQPNDLFICQKCGQGASTQEDLYRHQDADHPLEFLVYTV